MKKGFLIIAMALGAFSAAAQMTDVQVLEYVKNGLAQGKSQNALIAELASRGVDRAQAERVRQLYESQQTGATQAQSTAVAESRAHSVNAEVSMEPQSFEENTGSNVFGRDVFRNKSLNFAPSENLATPKNYRLGPGDEVIIDIFGANQTTIRNKISPEGSINVDVLGPVYLSGMTIDEANKFLKRKLAGIYGGLNRSSTGTDIRLSLGQIRSIQVNILGDVSNAGTYVLSSFSTVFHALYLAGGVVEPGSLRNITVNRGGNIVGTVDVYGFLMTGNRDSDIRLEEGDVVMVLPYTCMVTIGGEVKRPMKFEMKEGETLADLINYAGGFKAGAFTENLTVMRQSGKSYEIRTVDAKDFAKFELKDADQVTVGKLNSFYENRINITGAVYQPGTYEFGGEVRTVRELVEKAGGLLPDAFLNRAVLHREHEDKTREVISINLGRVMDGIDPDITLQKNDELFITSKADIQERGTMTVSGMVVNPATFPFANYTTIEDIIIMAGGLKEGASLARVDVSRRKRDASGLMRMDEVGELISLSLNENFEIVGGEKFYLQPYDEVIVHMSPAYNVQTHVTLTGEANFAGSFTLTNRNERLSDLVKKAGGVTKYAYLKGARLFRNMKDDERRQLLEILRNRTGNNQTQLDTAGIYQDQVASNYQVAIHLDKALANPGSEYDIELQEGDVLDIPMVRNTVRVVGCVMMPTVITYQAGKTAGSYVRDCGGFAKRAQRGKAFVVHMNGRSERLGLGTQVLPGDEIVVPERAKPEGVSDRAFERGTQAITALASMLMSASYLWIAIERAK
ncbi:MAG: SLBB domain-containing protein [Bacteroidales bacterium]|nr:SLBB domain-containing protein [Bacteroidales bacterium]